MSEIYLCIFKGIFIQNETFLGYKILVLHILKPISKKTKATPFLG